MSPRLVVKYTCLKYNQIWWISFKYQFPLITFPRSAEKLFREKRSQHVIFEYTTYWTDRSTQKDLLPFIESIPGAKILYTLHRTDTDIDGSLNREILDGFYENHRKKYLQTDIHATFVHSDINTFIEAQLYDPMSSFA